MPPKPQKESKKTEQKRQEKVIEDKTFGLKNKNKSKAVQSYVKSVTAQVKGQTGKGGESKKIADEFAQKAAQKKEEEKKALLASLFKSVKKTQEIIESSESEEEQDNYQEIDLYVDQREQIYKEKEGAVSEEIENWHANKDKTDKVCKFFLDSVESGKYGWRWICPNGIGCIYRHALPPGYTLKRDQPFEEKKDECTLEEGLEQERAQLQGGTPVTLERFLKWKADKKLQKEKEEKKKADDAKKTAGKGANVLSGRALFTYDPTLFQDDAEALDDAEYAEEENREDEEEKQNGDVQEEDEEYEEDGEEEQEPQEKEWGKDNTAAAEKVEVQEGETKEGEQAAEAKKKKKKKAKKKTDGDNGDVKINEDVFLNEEDVELPEDDS